AGEQHHRPVAIDPSQAHGAVARLHAHPFAHRSPFGLAAQDYVVAGPALVDALEVATVFVALEAGGGDLDRPLRPVRVRTPGDVRGPAADKAGRTRAGQAAA